MENKSISLVFISTFGAELDSMEGDDFDKEVLNNSKWLVVNSTFVADVACRDDQDGFFFNDDEIVNEAIMVVESSACTVAAELTSGEGNNSISCFDEAVIEFVGTVVYPSVELAFGGNSGCISCFVKESLIKSIMLVVTSSLGVELALKGSSG